RVHPAARPGTRVAVRPGASYDELRAHRARRALCVTLPMDGRAQGARDDRPMTRRPIEAPASRRLSARRRFDGGRYGVDHGPAYLGDGGVPLLRAGRTARQIYARQPWLAVRRSDHRDDRARTPFPRTRLVTDPP